MAKRVRRALSTATKYKMSLAKQGSKNPRYGKHLTEEQKKAHICEYETLLAVNTAIALSLYIQHIDFKTIFHTSQRHIILIMILLRFYFVLFFHPQKRLLTRIEPFCV